MKSGLGILEWGDNIKNKCYWKYKPASPLVSANVLFGEFEKNTRFQKKCSEIIQPITIRSRYQWRFYGKVETVLTAQMKTK